jgi:hypothetical protein
MAAAKEREREREREREDTILKRAEKKEESFFSPFFKFVPELK